MRPVLLTRTKHIIPIGSFLRNQGAPVERLLQNAKLPSDCLANPNNLVPSVSAFEFREIAARTTGLPNIALDVTQNFEIEDLGEFGAILLRAPTLYRLLNDFQRLSHTESTTPDFELRMERDRIWFSYRLGLGRILGHWHSDIYILQLMLKLVRLASSQWSPDHLCVFSEENPDRRAAITELGIGSAEFGCDKTGFAIPRSMLAMPLTNNSRLPSTMATPKDRHLAPNAPAIDFSGSIRQLLIGYSGDRWLDIKQVAEIIRSEPRTLQRRLAEERMTFSMICNDARMEIATSMLQEANTDMRNIALRLGYSTQSNFGRAFLQWTGVTPGEFRKLRCQDATS